MKKSNLYKTLTNLRTDLSAKLNELDNYFDEGEATTTIFYYNYLNKLIQTRKISSKWTTALGKDRVKKNHLDFIKNHTSTVPRGTHTIKVSSPFKTTSSKYICIATYKAEKTVTIF